MNTLTRPPSLPQAQSIAEFAEFAGQPTETERA
jgi:hypothetical protein